MIVKVKEPIEPEYPLVRKGQVVFTYFHFACEEELTHAMLKSGATCIAYETVERDDRSLPLLCDGHRENGDHHHVWRIQTRPTEVMSILKSHGFIFKGER